MNPLHPINPEIVNQIQENLIAYFRIYAGLPGTTFVEDAEMTWNRGGPGSFILRTHLSVDTVEQRIDEIIGKIKSVYQRVGFVPIALGMREYEWKRR